MRTVICDDDRVLRSVVAGIVAGTGHRVVGETGHGEIAIDLVRDLSPEILVLDLSLETGLGTRVLHEVNAAYPSCRVVVFSAFVTEQASLRAAGAEAVIEKPAFDQLEQLLEQWAASAPAERRRPTPGRTFPAHAARSPSGIEPATDFYNAIASTQAGDALVVAWLPDLADVERRDGPHIALDWVLEIARRARGLVRADDRIACLDGQSVHVLLLDGRGEDGARVMTLRLEEEWAKAAAGGGPDLLTRFTMQDGTVSLQQLLHQTMDR
jgi:DNA-binding NarL/FixJ family response regulator